MDVLLQTFALLDPLDPHIGSQLHFSHDDYVAARCLNSRTFLATTRW